MITNPMAQTPAAWSSSWTRLSLRVALACACAPACNDEGETNVRLARSSDAPPVLVVAGSAQLDLGSAKEVEPNNDSSTATPIKLPVAVSGVLSSSADVDVFSFVAPAAGQARIFLRPVDGVDLMIEAGSDADDVRVADRGPDTSEGLPNMPVEKGKTYTIAVKEFIKKVKPRGKNKGAPTNVSGRRGDSPPYQLEVSLAAKPAASEGAESETEPNDSVATAKKILSGDRPGAYIGWHGDVDFYKLSLEGFTDEDLVEISVDGVDGVTLSLELTSSSGEKLLTRRGEKSGPIYVRGLQHGRADHLIAKLSAKRSNESERYRFHFATRRAADGEEVEPNDTAKSATEIGERGGDKASTRAEIDAGDTDWFRIPASAVRRELNVKISGDAIGKMQVEAVVAGEVVESIDGTSRSMSVVIEPQATLRVKVTSKGGNEPAEYTVAWSAKEIRSQPIRDPADELE